LRKAAFSARVKQLPELADQVNSPRSLLVAFFQFRQHGFKSAGGFRRDPVAGIVAADCILQTVRQVIHRVIVS